MPTQIRRRNKTPPQNFFHGDTKPSYNWRETNCPPVTMTPQMQKIARFFIDGAVVHCVNHTMSVKGYTPFCIERADPTCLDNTAPRRSPNPLCERLHINQRTQGRSPSPVCSPYLMYGYCYNENMCDYLHILPSEINRWIGLAQQRYPESHAGCLPLLTNRDIDVNTISFAPHEFNVDNPATNLILLEPHQRANTYHRRGKNNPDGGKGAEGPNEGKGSGKSSGKGRLIGKGHPGPGQMRPADEE